MQKDLRGREALRLSVELAPFSAAPGFDAVSVQDLRKLAELVKTAGSVDDITLDAAAAFGGSSRHRLQCARRALGALAGDDSPATRAVAAALTRLQHGRRSGTQHRDYRTREAIFAETQWAAFRSLPGATTVPLNELRVVDRYLLFCAQQGAPGGELPSFLGFAAEKESSMLLRTLRDGLEHILTASHPVVAVAEQARSAKEAERAVRRKPAPTPPEPRALEVSVPYEALPEAWRTTFESLRRGRKVGRQKLDADTVDHMVYAIRQLVKSARDAGLPDEISLDTLGAYDADLEKRAVRPTSCSIYFTSIRTFARVSKSDSALVDDLTDLVAHYDKKAKGIPKVKERKMADLPDLVAIFDRANALLDQAEKETDRREKITLYVDAAALVFLSIIPLRNQDTVLRWGEHICHMADDDPADGPDEDGEPEPLGYHLDLRTSKRGVELSGPLAPILTPFLDALILQGRDERLLPQLRKQAAMARLPVFPKSGGQARGADSLSDRWRAHLGVGSGISRTRVHTMLGNLGEHGVRAALTLCAQRSERTAPWYQADSLARRHMHDSQEMIAELVELSDEDAELLAALGDAGADNVQSARPATWRAA